jgi:ABC-type transport system involved in multi-copper enzyme maturation permease subunit
MKTSIRYVLITALRDWLFFGLLVGVVGAAMISGLLGSTAFIEQQEMTVSYAAASARLILVIGLIVFVCFHIRSAFDTREIDVMLSRPISRQNLVLAYWCGFAAVALLLVVPTVSVIFYLGVANKAGFAGWALSLLLETLLVVALALFASLALKSAVTSVMACMGIYVLSRMMAFFVLTSHSGMLAQNSFWLVRQLLTLISIIVPRLDFFAKTEWLVYGFRHDGEVMLAAVQAVVFIPLLLAASIADFRRKQF